MMVLKNIRENAGFTQLYVASKADISVRAYQNYEAGDRIPNVITAQRIAKALGKKVDELFPVEPT